jgi:hypothetical protein
MKITKQQHVIGFIVVIVLITAGSFFGGMKYQQSKQPSFGGRQFAGAGTGGAGGAGGNRVNGSRPVMGQIISADANSITVKSQDGSSKIVIVSTSTAINKAASGTIADLTVGQTVSAFGTTNTDGSITAQNIQLNPQQRGASGSGVRTNNP